MKAEVLQAMRRELEDIAVLASSAPTLPQFLGKQLMYLNDAIHAERRHLREIHRGGLEDPQDLKAKLKLMKLRAEDLRRRIKGMR
jgi:hypothetical protein